ncbi:hypothetical protein [Sphingobium ummariense]|uniref:hypothetical protein n=1 Tax=Sphingobium ummariense TaxID=420994 RepID=UPI00137708A8|nr:hypothetical protein [Sphingobium ummariense]
MEEGRAARRAFSYSKRCFEGRVWVGSGQAAFGGMTGNSGRCAAKESFGNTRPIVNMENCCQPPSMIKHITLGLCLIVVPTASPAAGQDSDGTESLQTVRGYLDAHWEYPNFVPDKNSGLKVMDFQIRDEKWLKIYFSPVSQAMMFRPDETVCFRVIGQGFLAPRRPSFMQPWEGSQFIFVKIKKLKRLKSNEKCAAPQKANLR